MLRMRNKYCSVCLSSQRFLDLGAFLVCERCTKRLERVIGPMYLQIQDPPRDLHAPSESPRSVIFGLSLNPPPGRMIGPEQKKK